MLTYTYNQVSYYYQIKNWPALGGYDYEEG